MKNTKLEQYFDRIFYTKNAGVDMETLKGIHELQPQYITFENIDTYTGHVPNIDIDSVFNKLVIGRRGGYCYEQNVLLKNVLESIGFNVEGRLGRVLWRKENDSKAPPRTHMLLIVTLNGTKYLVDSGFGTMTLTSPLVLNSVEVQTTPNGVFQISQEGQKYILSLIAGEKMPIYEFSPEPAEPSDVEVSNWYVATYPTSMFTKNLVVTKVDATARYTLNNKSLNIRYNDGTKESIEIDNPQKLLSLLETMFHINLENINKELLIRKFNGEIGLNN